MIHINDGNYMKLEAQVQLSPQEMQSKMLSQILVENPEFGSEQRILTIQNIILKLREIRDILGASNEDITLALTNIDNLDLTK